MAPIQSGQQWPLAPATASGVSHHQQSHSYWAIATASGAMDTRASAAVLDDEDEDEKGAQDLDDDDVPEGLSWSGGDVEDDINDILAPPHVPEGWFQSMLEDPTASFPTLNALSINEPVSAGAAPTSSTMLAAAAETSPSVAHPSHQSTTATSSHSPHVNVPPSDTYATPHHYLDITSNVPEEIALQLRQVARDPKRFFDIADFVGRLMKPPKDGIGRSLEGVRPPTEVTREDVDEGLCDVQGIPWESLSLDRGFVRAQRSSFEAQRLREMLQKNEVQRPSLLVPAKGSAPIFQRERFSFGHAVSGHRARIIHYQLRNLLTLTSRNDVFYSTMDRVMHTDVYGRPATVVMDFSDTGHDTRRMRITTVAAAEDILVAGGFFGDYAITHLRSECGTPPTLGRATIADNGITNHVHIFQGRSGGAPQAALSSNDNTLRVLDCNTNTITRSFQFNKAINCSATSPNSRMRAVVGDFHDVLITNAETGETLEALPFHAAEGFGCAWADDGIHVATSAQDYTIAIWDARSWKRPLATLPTQDSIVRSLRFSPVGGGPRVLCAAHADDFITIADAVTFEVNQQIDMWGPIAGIAMTPDGSELVVANADDSFGGLMRFERNSYDWQMQTPGRRGPWRTGSHNQPGLPGSFDPGEPEWQSDSRMLDDPRVALVGNARRRRGYASDPDAEVVVGGAEWIL